MCLGIPGKVIQTYEENDLLMGKVDFGGVSKEVCLAHVPEAQPGNYVIVHVGFGLSIVDEEEAQFIFSFLERMGELNELQDDIPPPGEPAAEAQDAHANPSTRFRPNDKPS